MKIVDIKLNYTCNNNCILCCQENEIKKADNTLTTEQVKDILQQNYEHYIKNGEQLKLTLTGGEPTLHTGLKEIIGCAQRLGYNPIQLQTNAIALSDASLTKEIIELGVTSFGISLHGNIAEMHEGFTRRQGSFEKTIQALKELKKYNVMVAINVVISRLNVKQLAEIVEFIGVNGLAQSVQLAFIHIIGRAANEKELVVSISEAAEQIKKGFEVGKKYDLNITCEAMPFCLMRGYEKQIAELHLDEDIIVYDKKGEIYFSKYRKNEFKLKSETCKKCIFYNLCEGPWREYPETYGWDEFIPIREF